MLLSSRWRRRKENDIPAKRPIRIKRIIPLLILAFSLISGLLLLRPVEDWVRQRMEGLRSVLLDQFRSKYGLVLGYQRMDYGFLMGIRVSGASISWLDGEKLLYCRDLSIDYDLFALIAGDYGRVIKGMDMDHAEFSMDVDKRAGFLESLGLVPGSGTGQKFSLRDLNSVFNNLARSMPQGLAFRVRDLALDLKGADFGASSRLDSLSLVSGKQELDLEASLSVKLEIPEALVPRAMASSGKLWLSTDLSLTAQYFVPRRELQLTLSSGDLDTPWFVLKPQSFRVLLGDRSLSLLKVDDAQALDATLGYDEETDSVKAHFESQGWHLLSIMRPKLAVADLFRMASKTSFNMAVDMEWHPASGEMQFGGRADASGWFPGIGEGSMGFTLKGNQNYLNFKRAYIESRVVSARASGTLGYRNLGLDMDIDASSQELLPGYPARITGHLGGDYRQGYTADQIAVQLGQDNWSISGFSLHPGSVIHARGNLAMPLELIASLEPRTEAAPEGQIQVPASGQTAIALGPQVQGSSLPKPESLDFDLGISTSGFPLKQLILDFHDWQLRSTDSLARLGLEFLGGRDLMESLAAQAWTVKANGRITWDQPEGSQVFSPELLTSPGFRLGFAMDDMRLETDLAMKDRILETRSASFVSGPVKAAVRGKVDFREPGKLVAEGGLTVNFFPEFTFKTTYSYGQQLDFQTSNGIQGDARFLGDSISGFLRIDHFPLAMLGITGLDGALTAAGSWSARTPQDWSMDLELLDFGFMKLNPLVPAKKIHVWARNLVLGPDGLVAKSLNVQDTVSLLGGELSMKWGGSANGGLEALASLSRRTPVAVPMLPASPSGESYQASFGLHGTELEGSLTVRGSPLGRFVPEGVAGGIDLDASLSGNLASPLLKGNFRLLQGSFNKDTLQAGGKFEYSPQSLGCSDLFLALGNNRLSVDALTWKPGDRKLDSRGRIENKEWAAGNTIPWSLSTSWAQGGIWKGFNGSLKVSGLPQWMVPSRTWELGAHAENGIIVFDELSGHSLKGHVTPDASYALELAKPFPVQAVIDGFFKGTRMEASLHNLNIEASLSKYLPISSVFWMPDGRIAGELRIVGDVNDPGFYGNLKGENLGIWLSYMPEKARVRSASMVLEGHVMRLLPVVAVTGTGQAQVDLQMELSKYNFQSIALKVQTLKDSTLVMDTSFPGIKVAGKIKGNMDFLFLPAGMKIAGGLTAEDMVISLGPWDSGSSNDQNVPEYDVGVDLQISTAKGTTFMWPSRELPVLTAYINPNQSVRFNYDSLRGTYSLKGQVKSRGGSISYLKRDFMLRDTLLEFNESERGFDPLVTLKAELRTFIDNQSYRLSLLADHQRLSQLFQQTLRLESEPALSQGQIAALLSGDTIVENNTADVGSKLVSTAADYLVNQLAFKNVLEPIRKALDLDLLFLRTSVVQNAAAEILNPLLPIDNEIDSLGKYLDGTSLMIGKYLGPDLYLEGSAQLHQTDLGYGNKGGILGLESLSLGLELDMEWNTPIFNLVWSFRPKLENASEFFLPDNTFSFTFDLIR